MSRSVSLAAVCWLLFVPCVRAAEPPKAGIALEPELQNRCLTILREGLQSDEFWPAMHAAEGLSIAGHGDEVRAALTPRLPTETDDQRRCGLARELVRAGDVARTQILFDILAGADDYGHTHAAESLYKVRQQGDGRLLRKAMQDQDAPKKALMAAAALARHGHADARTFIRGYVDDPDGETAKVAAWILARVGDRSDLPGLRRGVERFSEPLTKAYFQHALASLGDPAGRAALVQNLRHRDPAVRVYAAEFAPDARAVDAREALIACLSDDVLDVRIRAAHALLALAQPADATN